MNSKTRKRNLVGLIIILGAALFGLIALNSGPVSAERGIDVSKLKTAGQEAPADTGFSGTALPSLLRLFAALVIVIACIYGGIWLLKRSMGRAGGNGNHAVEVLETTGIAPKKTISLVRVADKSVLVGVTENGMSLLTELSAEQTAEIIASRETAQSDDQFQQALKTASTKLRSFTLKRKRAALES